MVKVVHALLNTHAFDEHPEIIFSTNQKSQTLICQAAQLGYAEVVGKLFALTHSIVADIPVDERSQSPGYKIWLKQDEHGYTPLHYVILIRNSALVNSFIDLTKQEVNSADLINLETKHGDTPLHFALQNEESASLADILLTAGADLSRVNNQLVSPFGLLCQRDADSQVRWISKLSGENKQKLLVLYKDYVTRHPEDEKTRKIYFSLVGSQMKLIDLAAAHLELDPNVHVKDAYYASVAEDGFTLVLTYRNIPSDERIRRDIESKKDIAYLYLDNDIIKFAARDAEGMIQRVSLNDDFRSEYYLPIKVALQDVANLKQLNKYELEQLAEIASFYGYHLLVPPYKNKLVKKTISNTKINDPELAKRLPRYLEKLATQNIFAFRAQDVVIKPSSEQLLTQDKNTLSEFIYHIEAYLQDWSSRKPWETNKALSVIVPILGWLVYGGIEAWLIYATINETNHPAYLAYNGQPAINYADPVPDGYQGYRCKQDMTHYHPYEYSGGRQVWQEMRWIEKCDMPEGYFNASISFGVIGIVASGITSCVTPSLLWNKKPAINISHNEWRESVQLLQQNVIEKLTLLKDIDLPTNGEQITDLVAEAAKLNATKSQDETIVIFSRILNI